jgi:hypothetical protein
MNVENAKECAIAGRDQTRERRESDDLRLRHECLSGNNICSDSFSPFGKGNIVQVVIIGGFAAVPKAASKIIRLKPDTDVTIIEKGAFLSYAV